MNTSRPLTNEEFRASAELLIEGLMEENDGLKGRIRKLLRDVRVQERYARMLRKKWKRTEALVHVREDE